jgi:hypothetical protein
LKVEIFPTYSFQLTPYNQKKIRKYLHRWYKKIGRISKNADWINLGPS